MGSTYWHLQYLNKILLAAWVAFGIQLKGKDQFIGNDQARTGQRLSKLISKHPSRKNAANVLSKGQCMRVTMLKAKLHKACVTHSSPHDEGAFAIDGDLLELAGIAEYEQIQVYNMSSGERFASHAVRAEHGSRKVAVGGTPAQSVAVGDRLVICAYAGFSNRQTYGFKPLMVYCDEQNFVVGAKNAIPLQIAS